MAHEKKCTWCPAQIIWAVTPKGKKVPLEAEPIDPATLPNVRGARGGAFALQEWPDEIKDPPIATWTHRDEAMSTGERLYLSHIPCPNR